METPRYPNHELACSKGGVRQSNLEYYCTECKVFGSGNRFLQFHIKDSLCNGQGLKNKYSIKRNLFK